MENYDLNAEKRVLGCLMAYANAYSDNADILNVRLFYHTPTQETFKAIAGCVADGQTPDLIAVNAYCRRHKYDVETGFLADCLSMVLSLTELAQDIRLLDELRQRRELWTLSKRLETVGCGVGEIDDIKHDALNILQNLDAMPSSNIVSVGSVWGEIGCIIEENKVGTIRRGMPTGFKTLDEKGGLQFGDLVVIAADSSTGKTAFSLDVCRSVAAAGWSVAFYSLEMGKAQLTARMTAQMSGVQSNAILKYRLSDDEERRARKAGLQLSEYKIYFDDAVTNIDAIIASIRTMARRKGVKLAVVDYLQILASTSKERTQTDEAFLGQTARRFKNLAKELNICLIVLSQISRDKTTTEPILSRLRGSGQITEAADMVLTIYRPELYNQTYSGNFSNHTPQGTALIRLAKGRNVGTDAFICRFNAITTHFYDADDTLSLVQINSRNDDNLAPF